jgi:hypothetical protein
MTLEWIPRGLLQKTILLVNRKEFKEYRDRYSDLVRVQQTAVEGISKTRQYAITHIADREEVECILMLDDDMRFYKRPDMSKPGLVKSTPGQVRAMLDKMAGFSMLPNFFACGLSARQGNNHIDKRWIDNTRMMNAYAINVTALRKEKVKFSETQVMEDFWVTLNMLTRGYKNRVLYEFCWNQNGSNDSGGCSSYRTAKVQAGAAMKLHREFPDFVKLVTKTAIAPKYWEGMKERTDVRIQWKKAYESSNHNS